MKIASIRWLEKPPEFTQEELAAVERQDDEDGSAVYMVPSSGGKTRYKVWLSEDVGACTCAGWGTKCRAADEAGEDRAEPCRHLSQVRSLLAGLPSEAPSVAASGEEVAPPTSDPSPPKEKTEQVFTPRSRTIWPSAVPLVEKCRAALELTEVMLDTSGPAAAVGSAVHDIARDIVVGKLSEAPEPAPYLAQHGLGDEFADDLKYLGIFAWQAWGQLKKYFENPQVEIPLRYTAKQGRNAVTFSGKADVLEIWEDRATVLDWKSGRKEDDYLGQLKTYAVMAAAQDKRIKTVTAIIVWLRSQSVVTVTFTRKELREWLAEFLKRYSWWDGRTYGPGDHCAFCKRRIDCPGRLETIRHGVVALSGDVPRLLRDESGNLLPADMIYSAYQQAKLLEQAIKEFKSQLSQELGQAGPLPIPQKEGYALDLIERQGKASLDMAKAWPVITEELTREELRGIIDIPLTKLKDAVAAKAERGQKKARIDALMERLDGAIVRAPSVRYPAEVKIEGGSGG